MTSDIRFDSFFMAGFECSSHRRPDGVRLDLLAGTGHDRFALQDYRACRAHGIRSARDGLRWHLIEQSPHRYDWSSWLPMLHAAESAGMQVVWDLLHYGSPDGLDQGGTDFIGAYAAFAAEAVRVHRAETGRPAWVCPVNEISYFTWAARTGYFPAVGPDESGWLKRHLVSAAIAGVRAMRAVDPDVRFFWAEPLIHILPARGSGEEVARAAESARQSQFEAYDMLLGRAAPELGGTEDIADCLGLNFYPENQWFLAGSTVPLGHHGYRPLSDLLQEVAGRYGKPIFLSETGAEASGRAAWLHYVSAEVREAMRRGVDVRGICLYPITSYPGWDDFRDTATGLFSVPRDDGTREVCCPMAEELRHQVALFEAEGVGSTL